MHLETFNQPSSFKSKPCKTFIFFYICQIVIMTIYRYADFLKTVRTWILTRTPRLCLQWFILPIINSHNTAGSSIQGRWDQNSRPVVISNWFHFNHRWLLSEPYSDHITPYSLHTATKATVLAVLICL